eukprot:4577018-Pyramimonas_sp.AAC.1
MESQYGACGVLDDSREPRRMGFMVGRRRNEQEEEAEEVLKEDGGEAGAGAGQLRILPLSWVRAERQLANRRVGWHRQKSLSKARSVLVNPGISARNLGTCR